MSETTASPPAANASEALPEVVTPAPVSPPEDTEPDALRLAAMLDIPVRLTVELGRAELTLAEVLALRPGAVVELDRLAGDPVDLLANGRLIARGEILVINEGLALRVLEVLPSPPDQYKAA